MTPYEKRMPNRLGSPIDEIHVNTGYTFSCKRANEMYIYRQEEWFKVLIHETFHSFLLDFSSMSHNNGGDDAILSMFSGLHTDLRFYESYTEIWAEIIHTIFIGYSHHRSSIKSIFDAFKRNILKERKHSLCKAHAILHHYGLSYRDIIGGGGVGGGGNMRSYKENTPVFAYFIIKSCWIYHIDQFINWCAEQNGGSIQFRLLSNKIQSFCRFYQSLYDKPDYVSAMDMKTLCAGRSLRMTCLDVDM